MYPEIFRECGHSVTGESHCKANGKRYVYYRCANQECPQRKKTISQTTLQSQIIDAFKPFSCFTAKKCQELKKTLKGRISDIHVDSCEKVIVHDREAKKLKANVTKFQRLYEDGVISATEFNGLFERCKREIAELEARSTEFKQAENATKEQADSVIELLPLFKDFFRLSRNLVIQAEIAKIILSNRLLKDGTMRFRYINPFDVYIEIGRCQGEWPHQESNLELSFRKALLYPFNYGAN